MKGKREQDWAQEEFDLQCRPDKASARHIGSSGVSESDPN